MKHQLVEINDQYPFIPSNREIEKPAATLYDASFWLDVYPPLVPEECVQIEKAKRLCPWTMAAELADRHTAGYRKSQILRAFQNGRKAMKGFHLPADRFVFLEDFSTRKITIWIN